MARYLGGIAFELLDKLKRALSLQEGRELFKLIQATKVKQRFLGIGFNAEQHAAEEALVKWVNLQIEQKYQGSVQFFSFETEEAARLIYALDDNGRFKSLKSLMPLRVALQPGMLRNILLLGLGVLTILGSLAFLNLFSIPVGISLAAITYASGAAFAGSVLTSFFTFAFLPKIDTNIVEMTGRIQPLKKVDFGIKPDSSAEIADALSTRVASVPSPSPHSTPVSGSGVSQASNPIVPPQPDSTAVRGTPRPRRT